MEKNKLERNLILVINGPNLNMLEYREEVYGNINLNQIYKNIEQRFNDKLKKINDKNLDKIPHINFFQTNIEGEIINKVYENINILFGVIINPGALTHYSYSILDLFNILKKNKILIAEVHITNPLSRGRENLLTTKSADFCFMGMGIYSYLLALDLLLELYFNGRKD